MAYGQPTSLYGPGGRFDLADPTTQAMVRQVSQNPDLAPKYMVTLPEIYALQNALKNISTKQQAQPQTTTVYDDLKNAAIQLATAGQIGQMPQPPQGLAQIAQQPMPQPMPQEQSVEDSGIAQLPVDNFQPENFAGGGIVAFADGGATTEEVNRMLNADRYNQFQPRYGDAGLSAVAPNAAASNRLTSMGLANRLLEEQNQALRDFKVPTLEEQVATERRAREAAGIKGLLGERYVEELQAKQGRMEEDKSDAARMALAKFGFGWAERASKPGASIAPLGAAAGAATEGLSDYMSSIKELKKIEAERAKEIASIENLRRAEDLGVVKDASATIAKKEAHLEKLTERKLSTQAKIVDVLSSKESTAAQLEARREEAREGRETQLKIAEIQANRMPDLMRVADSQSLKDAMPDKTFLQRLEAASQAMHPKDIQNAVINATTKAAEAAAKEWESALIYNTKLREDYIKAQNGDKEAAARVKVARDSIEREAFKHLPQPGAKPGSQGPALPMPSEQKDLVEGKVYKTNRGNAVWDGSKFNLVP